MNTVAQAYAYCEWMTYRHYENFPVASWMLPRSVRPHVAAVYAFARAADDFADEARYAGRGLDLLAQWRENLNVIATARHSRGGKQSNHPIFIALADTVQKKNIPVQLLDDLLTAFMMDITKRRYADWDELMTYCRYSANPVGRIVLHLFEITDPALHLLSDKICTGLQLANHWQDLRIDAARDMFYLPADLMKQYGVTEQEINRFVGLGMVAASSEESLSSGYRAMMKELVVRARILFEEGKPLVGHLKGGLRAEIALTVLGGQTILDRIDAVNYDVFRHRPEISTLDKTKLLIRALFS